MKKRFLYSALILIMLTVYAFKNQEQPHEVIRQRYSARFTVFKEVLSNLKTVLDNKTHNNADKEIPEAYDKLRESYKSLEYLLAYTDPSFVTEYINGAPLPSLEKNTFAPLVIEPHGLQVIDELMSDTDDDSFRNKTGKQVDMMITACESYYPKKVYSHQVFEAARSGLIRIYTLGLTGFDVPGTDHALSDAVTGLETMREDLLLFRPALQEISKPASDSLYSSFENCLKFMNSQKSFDKLDRFSVFKDHIDPLYRILGHAHYLLGYEMPHEVSAAPAAVNYQAGGLFDPSFLNASYYVAVPHDVINSKTSALGRLLFFDPVLSSNRQRACASCHDPAKAFTDGKPKSEAFDHAGTVSRNAPVLVNCVYSDRYFHDMRARDLTDQMEHVITNSKEFNTEWDEIVATLNQSKTYRELFAEAFGSEPETSIDAQNIRFAMASFISGLQGFHSRFDLLVRNEMQVLTKEDKAIVRGFNLFMGKAACGTCHFAPVFNGTVPPFYTESESEVLGVPENPAEPKPVLGEDRGRGKAHLKEQLAFYMYSFKTPTVRNIALTAPYMHNGVYPDLESVMDFYNKGGGAGIGINLPHQTLSSEPLNLNKKEIADIIDFMKALTDSPFTAPDSLPPFESRPEWNSRKIGGVY